jgi:biotin operon repressor
MATEKRNTAFRLTEEVRQSLLVLAERLGMSQTGVVEFAVRQLAKKEGVPVAVRKQKGANSE